MATRWGAGRYTTAPGTAAASATTARRASRTGQTASKPIWAAPALRKEAATARSPATVATPARGTTPRFTTTPIVESWLKWVRVIGRTASWAAALTAIAPAITPRGIGAATMPAGAAEGGWKPGAGRAPRPVAGH